MYAFHLIDKKYWIHTLQNKIVVFQSIIYFLEYFLSFKNRYSTIYYIKVETLRPLNEISYILFHLPKRSECLENRHKLLGNIQKVEETYFLWKLFNYSDSSGKRITRHTVIHHSSSIWLSAWIHDFNERKNCIKQQIHEHYIIYI